MLYFYTILPHFYYLSIDKTLYNEEFQLELQKSIV